MERMRLPVKGRDLAVHYGKLFPWVRRHQMVGARLGDQVKKYKVVTTLEKVLDLAKTKMEMI